MRLLTVILSGWLLRGPGSIGGQELSVTRLANGDVFTVEGSCREACTVLSSGTASPFTRDPETAAVGLPDHSCACQCNLALPVFREDLHVCVKDIQECDVAGFVGTAGAVEKIPYVFLPQRRQIVYPQAEIRFEGVETPVCGIAGAQQLGRGGWSELRNLSDVEPPFRLFRDEGRTFLQWIGDAGLRDAAEGRVVLARLVCRDASPQPAVPGVFTPCVAFRVAGSPSKSNVREVAFSAGGHPSQGLSATEYAAIGLSSVVLALIYVASVSLYLQSRRARRKRSEEPEAALTGGREGAGIVKSNPLLAASRRFEADANGGSSESDLGDDPAQSDGEETFENVTSAVVHPPCVYFEPEGTFGSGSILGERLPEEDVRIVETVDNAHQQDVPVLPGTQRRKLYFNPAYFDRQLLLAPPPAAVEFLFKIREVVSIAKHKMAAKRFVPTLIGIPEEESGPDSRRRPASVQGSAARSRGSRECTGCPGCRESPPSLPVLPASPHESPACPGENRIRAWLEDVKPPGRRWTSPVAGPESLGASRRSTRSTFGVADAAENGAVNAKVRRAIENCFVEQMEENAVLEKMLTEATGNGPRAEERSATRRKSRKSRAPSTPGLSRLPDMIDELPGATMPAKRIMDAVIREMVDAKAVERNERGYEVDSLERAKLGRKPSTSPEYTDRSSPAPSTALPLDEELTMRNDILERSGPGTEEPGSRRPVGYSLVSEVYVNDGYVSPAGSEDSGPEIRYEPEHPGHLTIKVQDSPDNYVKLDESEYEPDTLDRKPMKLRINGDVGYERDPAAEVYVDSLERPAQILLRSKGSFGDGRGSHGSLREIYQARLSAGHLVPDSRQARRQRKPSNRPDVVPLPPAEGGHRPSRRRGRLVGRVEDSGYLSSTDSNGSRKRLLRPDVGSVSETDETESVCDGASESGAESVGTDSVFFGNFPAAQSSRSKSVDSGFRNEDGAPERANHGASDSEAESFVTVLPPGSSLLAA
ncbi:uncharacterized protein LOC105695453 [Orussus abietinus]|uniref:uncharacterized protein LOC105695453 n=1 Tax=Orussus abietinus TaxID=222816 RepID=UPI0006255955|nr:uncharacterized protein LOC105695453 [Orussus abietinus]